jgi:hypothetical protein
MSDRQRYLGAPHGGSGSLAVAGVLISAEN